MLDFHKTKTFILQRLPSVHSGSQFYSIELNFVNLARLRKRLHILVVNIYQVEPGSDYAYFVNLFCVNLSSASYLQSRFVYILEKSRCMRNKHFSTVNDKKNGRIRQLLALVFRYRYIQTLR